MIRNEAFVSARYLFERVVTPERDASVALPPCSLDYVLIGFISTSNTAPTSEAVLLQPDTTIFSKTIVVKFPSCVTCFDWLAAVEPLLLAGKGQ